MGREGENPSQVLRRFHREMVEECDRDTEEAFAERDNLKERILESRHSLAEWSGGERKKGEI
jgi:hypothetical protein|tara:strand:+ start:731 stop:916 length:186 start_codon:yes stop_codon:yes gene_type:complete